MNKYIDINCDLGESFGNYRMGNDSKIMPYISSCNIACGFHAGDPSVIRDTIKMALANDVSIGAHPSFPDLQGFGRRYMDINHKDLKAILMYQISALKGLTESEGGVLRHVKPHGALYNAAAKDQKLANCIAASIVKIDPKLIFVGMADSAMFKASLTHNLSFAHETFMDRNYQADGSLVPRSDPNAVITQYEEILERSYKMVSSGYVDDISGQAIRIHCDTLCLHGDNPYAAVIAQQLTGYFSTNDIKVRAL